MKSKIKSANATWLRFFALMGSAIAMGEKKPLVPNTPTDRAELVEELRAAIAEQNILDCLMGWGNTIKHIETQTSAYQDAFTFLLVLDTAKHFLHIHPFRKDQMEEAEAQYLMAEKQSEESAQVVLVSVESLGVLSKAYPNYYADTTDFLVAVRQEIGEQF
jgi:hypothetical protein